MTERESDRELPAWQRILRVSGVLTFTLLLAAAAFCAIMGWYSWSTYGEVLTWMGVILVIVGFALGMGGDAARRRDLLAFCITGQGDMGDHLRRHFQSTMESLQFLLMPVLSGVTLLVVGYLFQR